MAQQLAFSLPIKPALGRENYFVSQANSLAVGQIENWRDWPQGKLVLVGPSGAGKTHLAHVWAKLADAQIINAADLSDDRIEALAKAPVAVEDIDHIAGDKPAETQLFHLHNLALAEGQGLLMTSTRPPGRLKFKLKDLTSRMQATSIATLDALDDELLIAILLKLFADRQISPPLKLLDYIVPRIERSYSAAHAFVAALDARALAENKPIGKRLAREVLTGHLDSDPEKPS